MNFILGKASRKIVLGIAALLCCIAIIVLSSFCPFVIDPSRWQTKEFISDELIITAIVIFSIVCVMYIGQAGNAMAPESKLAQARVKFSRSVSLIKNISAFEQWVRAKLQPDDIQTERESILRKCGLDDFTIIKLEDSEIKALVGTPQKYGDRFYKGISKQQCREALRAKYFKMRLVNPTYYLVCSSISNDQTISRKSGNENKKKGVLLTWSIASKVVMSIVLAVIFASLVYDINGGKGNSTAWLKFASRMFSMMTSSFLGYLIGCQMNDIDADFIENKVLAHTKFLQDADFKPKEQQELARQEFVDRVRQENVTMIPKKGG